MVITQRDTKEKPIISLPKITIVNLLLHALLGSKYFFMKKVSYCILIFLILQVF